MLTVKAFALESDFPDEPNIINSVLAKPKAASTFEDKELNSMDIACMPYWNSSIINFFQYPTPQENDLELIIKDTSRWDPRLRILVTPQQAQEVFDTYYNKENRLLPAYAKDLKLSQEDALPLYEAKRREIFSHRFFGIPENEEDRRQFFLTHDISFLTRPLIQNVYKGAVRIMEKTSPGDTILIFGNTPYFVGRALEQLINTHPADVRYRNLVIFPFSGAPNQAREQNQKLAIRMSKDDVDEARLNHLRGRMKASGLSSNNPNLSRLFLVDVICSGSGPSYFLEELIRDHKQAQKELPEISLISMNVINIDNEKDHRHRHIASKSAADGETVTLCFPSMERRHFSVDNHVIHIEGHGFLDNLKDEQTMRALPAYNAHYWYPEFDFLLTKEQPRHMKKLFEYFDENVKALINNNSVI